jgi:hypothetical protein
MINAQTFNNGCTPLMLCTTVGDDIGTYLLLEAGADRGMKNAHGLTAFDINREACETNCGVNCLSCRHAHIRALLAMRTRADEFKESFPTWLGLTPTLHAEIVASDLDSFLQSYVHQKQ